jgi:hypothetical protein
MDPQRQRLAGGERDGLPPAVAVLRSTSAAGGPPDLQPPRRQGIHRATVLGLDLIRLNTPSSSSAGVQHGPNQVVSAVRRDSRSW